MKRFCSSVAKRPLIGLRTSWVTFESGSFKKKIKIEVDFILILMTLKNRWNKNVPSPSTRSNRQILLSALKLIRWTPTSGPTATCIACGLILISNRHNYSLPSVGFIRQKLLDVKLCCKKLTKNPEKVTPATIIDAILPWRINFDPSNFWIPLFLGFRKMLS